MPEQKGTAALYCRVSTVSQRDEGYSLDEQREKLTALCTVKDFHDYELYIDGAYSGKNLERPEMCRMLDDIKSGTVGGAARRITHVFVVALDRLSRSQKDVLYLLEDVFEPNGISLNSIRESFDTSSKYGKAMIGILAAFAQLERENIRERTRDGMLGRVKEGKWPGGGKIPFGYDYDRKRGILVPNADAETVRRIYKLYLEGYSPQIIADTCGLTYDKLVTQILTRRTNVGVIPYLGHEYPGKHEPIISAEVYDRAMEMMARRSDKRTAISGHLLTGLVVCGVCGAKMRYQKWGKSDCKFVCYSQQTSKKYLIRDENCDNERCSVYDIEDAVLADLFSLRFRLKDGTAHEINTASNPEILQKRETELQRKITNLYELYATDRDELLYQTILKYRDELSRIKELIVAQRERGEDEEKYRRARELVKNLKEMWDYMTIAEKQLAVRSCVEQIIITHGNAEVYYRF